MAKQYNTEQLSAQVVTYLSKYCKSELTSIEYYPQLHSFDLGFKINPLVNLQACGLRIHVQRPTMNNELYDVIIPLINMIHGEVTEDGEDFIDISFTRKRKISKAVQEYIVDNNIGTLDGIIKQFPNLIFAERDIYSIKQQASTVVSLGYRKLTNADDYMSLLFNDAGNYRDLPEKMSNWLENYPIFELAFDVDCPTKSSRVAFVTPDGFKDFFQFKYLSDLVQITEPTDFKPETTTKNAIAFDL